MYFLLKLYSTPSHHTFTFLCAVTGCGCFHRCPWQLHEKACSWRFCFFFFFFSLKKPITTKWRMSPFFISRVRDLIHMLRCRGLTFTSSTLQFSWRKLYRTYISSIIVYHSCFVLYLQNRSRCEFDDQMFRLQCGCSLQTDAGCFGFFLCMKSAALCKDAWRQTFSCCCLSLLNYYVYWWGLWRYFNNHLTDKQNQMTPTSVRDGTHEFMTVVFPLGAAVCGRICKYTVHKESSVGRHKHAVSLLLFPCLREISTTRKKSSLSCCVQRMVTKCGRSYPGRQ